MKNIYFISEFNDKGNNAGSKARNDLEQIFIDNKFIKLNNNAIIASVNKRNIMYFIKSFFGALHLFKKLSLLKKSVIFCQYPALKGKILYKALRLASKNNSICYIIHDIDALRFNQNQKNYYLARELSILNNASSVIVHNESMKNVLVENGLTTNVIVKLDLFDYLGINNKPISRKMDRNLVYAGNFNKGSFIDQISESILQDVQLTLYGPYFDDRNINVSNITYKGSLPPNEIADKLDGSFGLVWEGPSVDTCGGAYGEYTRYNNPHKLSLYIAAGLPVIVWSQAAIAKFVTDNNIGFTIESLSDIPNAFNMLDEKTYNDYIHNINKLREKVRTGYFTGKALEQIIKEVERG